MNIELNKVYHSEAIAFMEQLPDGYVDLTISSPPYGKVRQDKGDSIRIRDSTMVHKATRIKENVWSYSVGLNDKTMHPAPFPEQLVADHIISWSNKDDLIFDPMMGSGTVAKMSILLNRNFLGCDISEEYVALAKERIKPYQQQLRLSM